MIEFNVYGFPQMYEDLQKLDYSRQKVVLLRAVRAGGAVIRDRMAQLAPRDTGRLSDNIMMTTAGNRADIGSVQLDIGPSMSAFYGGFQELGTAHHPAQQFIDPAFDQTEDQALSAIAQTLAENISDELHG